MADPFIRYLEDQHPSGSLISINEIRNLKRKYDAATEFSDVDEDALVEEAEKVERAYFENAKRQKLTDDSPNEDEERYKCDICQKSYGRKKHLTRHLKSHTTTFPCCCGKEFTRADVLSNHKKICTKNISTLKNATSASTQQNQLGGDMNNTNRNEKSALEKSPLEKQAEDHTERDSAIESNDDPQIARENGETRNETPQRKKYRFRRKPRTKRTSAINDTVQVLNVFPQGSEKHDVLNFFSNIEQEVKRELRDRQQYHQNVKWYLNTEIQFRKDIAPDQQERSHSHFRSKTYIALENDDEEHDMNEAFQKMNQSLEEFIHQGSDWVIDNIVSLEICTVPYAPIGGSSYMELPKKVSCSKAVINIANQDQKCFLWTIIASLYPVERNPQNVKHYERYENELNMDGIEYPVSLKQIEKFERQNLISINVFGFDEGKIFPLYLSKLPNGYHEVDLLYLSNETNTHYCLIKNLNRFLRSTNKHHKHFYCRRCLHGFTRQDLLDAHRPYCDKFDFQRVNYPLEGKNTVEFKNFHKQIRIPFVIYADFETINKQNEDVCNGGVSTTHLAELEACGFSYYVVCSNDRYSTPPVVYRGADAADKFMEDLLREEKRIKEILGTPEPLIMSTASEEIFQRATNCYICGRKFHSSLIKVRDHDHVGVSGDINSPEYTNFRGANCQRCNLNLQTPSFIPVILHNCRGFDSHLIISAVGKHHENIQVIPNSMEKYISFQVSRLRFLDSFQFTLKSLENLVNSLAADGLTNFKHLTKTYPDQDIAKLLLRKNVYPYDYMDSHSKFDETQLPAKEHFFNRLKGDHIPDEDYEQVQKVWDALKMKTLGDLHDNYVKTDVILLSDVMECFRDMCMTNYSLDCFHYYTSPGLSYDAALKMSGVSLDLVTDPVMYHMFELQTRGGISMITKIFACANNANIPSTYNENIPNNYLIYLDANNLYGYAMSQSLPTGLMRFLDQDEIDSFNVQSKPIDGDKGYVLEVDLDYPIHLHDHHNDYPLAPTHEEISDDQLSPHSMDLWEKLYGDKVTKRTKVKKLVPTLYDKKKYILHYGTLQLYLKLGLKLKKIHRIIEFHQSTWLKKYIDFNAEKRSLAKNEFQKDFYKLMSNSVYGKTMENVRARISVQLIADEKKLKKYVAKPSFKRLKIFNEHLVGVEMRQVTINLNRPAYLGAQILDISKNLMTSFHYEIIKNKNGDKLKLLFTDTASLCYEISTPDLYEDLKDLQIYLDTSNYPKSHILYSERFRKVPGKFKDELPGNPMKEFIGLRPKMYSVLYEVETDGNKTDNDANMEIQTKEVEKKTAKGVTTITRDKQLTHERYKTCLLENEKTSHDMKVIRSYNHKLYLDNVHKTGLVNFDDKRYWLGIESMAFGHYKINNVD